METPIPRKRKKAKKMEREGSFFKWERVSFSSHSKKFLLAHISIGGSISLSKSGCRMNAFHGVDCWNLPPRRQTQLEDNWADAFISYERVHPTHPHLWQQMHRAHKCHVLWKTRSQDSSILWCGLGHCALTRLSFALSNASFLRLIHKVKQLTNVIIWPIQAGSFTLWLRSRWSSSCAVTLVNQVPRWRVISHLGLCPIHWIPTLGLLHFVTSPTLAGSRLLSKLRHGLGNHITFPF